MPSLLFFVLEDHGLIVIILKLSGVATGGSRGQSALLDSEKFAKNREKEGEKREKEGKNREKEQIGKVLSLCPS